MKIGALLWPAIACLFLNIGHVQSKQVPQIRLQQLQQADESLPKFEHLAAAGRGDGDVPKIRVTFPNGATDQLTLWHHKFNDRDAAIPKDCVYFGKLSNDPNSCVAVTGCIGTEDVEISISSDVHDTSDFSYVWHKEGHTTTNKGDKDLRPAEVNPFRSRTKREARSEGEIWANKQNLKTLPPTQHLKIKVAYDENYFDYNMRNVTKTLRHLKATIAHAQIAFCNPSLGTKVHIDVQSAIFLKGVSYKLFTSDWIFLERPTNEIMKEDPSTNLVVYLTGGHGGKSKLGGLCEPNRHNRYNANACTCSPAYCATIVRHEIGHSFGMSHEWSSDSGPCGRRGTVMRDNDRPEWSVCEVNQFRQLYTRRHANWCMKEYPTACTAMEKNATSEKTLQIEERTGLVRGLSDAAALHDSNLARKFIVDFINKGEDVNTADGSGRTHLYWAADLGYKDLATQLINLGADVNLADKRESHQAGIWCGEYTPLHRAAMEGHRDIATLLIDNGANVNSRNKWGWSPLHEAASHGHKEVGSLLIHKGADIEATTNFGESPLHLAAKKGRQDMTALLLENGANIHSRNKLGWSPLHEAASHGHKEVGSLLIHKGADIEGKTDGGESPLDVAVRKGRQDVAAFLRGAVSFQEQANPNYCQWDPSELNGGYSLGGGGHSYSACEQSCIERGYDCQMFTFFHVTGYCHQFKTCKNPSKISRHGAKMYIKRIASGQETPFLWQHTQNIWTDSQCSNIGNHKNLDVVECKRKCLATNGCGAINYGVNKGGICVLRACSRPIPTPEWAHDKYEGYYLKSGTECWKAGCGKGRP